MSKASEWAERLLEARRKAGDVAVERPGGVEVYVGDGWLRASVSESGLPSVVIHKNGQSVGVGGEVRSDNVPYLLDFARWLLDTFGEPNV